MPGGVGNGSETGQLPGPQGMARIWRSEPGAPARANAALPGRRSTRQGGGGGGGWHHPQLASFRMAKFCSSSCAMGPPITALVAVSAGAAEAGMDGMPDICRWGGGGVGGEVDGGGWFRCGQVGGWVTACRFAGIATACAHVRVSGPGVTQPAAPLSGRQRAGRACTPPCHHLNAPLPSASAANLSSPLLPVSLIPCIYAYLSASRATPPS